MDNRLHTILIWAGAGIAAVVLIVAAVHFTIVNKEAPIQRSTSARAPVSVDVFKSLSVPAGIRPNPVSPTVLKSLSVPKGAKPAPISQTVVDSLSVPK